MSMKDPVPQFTHIISSIRDLYPDFAYIHIVEPRVDGWATRDDVPQGQVNQSDFIHDLWAPKPIISVGAFDRELGLEVAEKKGHLIAYGRPFISNVSLFVYLVCATILIRNLFQPDLVRRLKDNISLAKGNRATYYAPRNFTSEGYTDYPSAT